MAVSDQDAVVVVLLLVLAPHFAVYRGFETVISVCNFDWKFLYLSLLQLIADLFVYNVIEQFSLLLPVRYTSLLYFFVNIFDPFLHEL